VRTGRADQVLEVRKQDDGAGEIREWDAELFEDLVEVFLVPLTQLALACEKGLTPQFLLFLLVLPADHNAVVLALLCKIESDAL
jgi:hypothetical protein